MSRKQIGLRMKDETRDQLERVRGGLSRTDYIEGAVLAQIARDLHYGKLNDESPEIISDPKWLKATITTVGTVVDGIAEGWAIEGGDYPGITRLEDGSELLGGWSIPELEQIAVLAHKPKSTDVNYKVDIIKDKRMPPNMAVTVPSGEVFVNGDKVDSEIIGDHTVLAENNKPVYDWPVRSSAESKSGVLPVPKKAVKGRK